MEGYLVLIASIAFFAYLLPGSRNHYYAILGWTGITAYLFSHLPVYFAENNFIYPALAVLSVPFLMLTITLLRARNGTVMQLSRAAAIAFLIFAPFAYIGPLGDLLISAVIGQVTWVLAALNFPVERVAWNMVMHDAFRVEIILACTGIQSIAIMLGVAGAVPTTTRQKVVAFLLVVPVIYVLNIFRNVFVIMGYTGQWFPYLPEIVSNGEYGYESFFWAHNVICELLALGILIGIAYSMFLLIPALGEFADDLITVYRDEIRRAFDRGRQFAGLRKG
jgi:archaeosortase A (PGF-CTERM-specific)